MSVTRVALEALAASLKDDLVQHSDLVLETADALVERFARVVGEKNASGRDAYVTRDLGSG